MRVPDGSYLPTTVEVLGRRRRWVSPWQHGSRVLESLLLKKDGAQIYLFLSYIWSYPTPYSSKYKPIIDQLQTRDDLTDLFRDASGVSFTIFVV